VSAFPFIAAAQTPQTLLDCAYWRYLLADKSWEVQYPIAKQGDLAPLCANCHLGTLWDIADHISGAEGSISRLNWETSEIEKNAISPRVLVIHRDKGFPSDNRRDYRSGVLVCRKWWVGRVKVGARLKVILGNRVATKPALWSKWMMTCWFYANYKD